MASSGIEFIPSLFIVRAGINRFNKKITNLIRPNRQVAHLLERWVNENFESEGGNVGGWAPLSAWTIRWRERKGYGSGPILINQGFLRNSFDTEVTQSRVTISTDIPYATYHQSGFTSPKGEPVPPRRVLPDQTDDLSKIYEPYERWFERVANQKLW